MQATETRRTRRLGSPFRSPRHQPTHAPRFGPRPTRARPPDRWSRRLRQRDRGSRPRDRETKETPHPERAAPGSGRVLLLALNSVAGAQVPERSPRTSTEPRPIPNQTGTAPGQSDLKSVTFEAPAGKTFPYQTFGGPNGTRTRAAALKERQGRFSRIMIGIRTASPEFAKL